MNNKHIIIMIICAFVLLGCTVSCSGINSIDSTEDSESVLYVLNYSYYSGLYCYIYFPEEYYDIEMYINDELVSMKDEPGYTYIPLEHIPAELFQLEVKIFNTNEDLIHDEIYNNVYIYDAEGKSKLEKIPAATEHLFVYNNEIIEDISVLKKTRKLKSIYLICGDMPIDLTPIKNLKQIKVLDVFYSDIQNIDALSNLRKLEYLTIGKTQIEDISALKKLSNLKYLDIGGNKINDISALSGLTNLEYLQSHSNNIDSLEALRNMKKLEYLNLADNQISNVEPLGELINLKDVTLASNKITDITPLAELENLYFLNIRNNDIEDYSVLDDLGIEYVK